jgi:uncharacterized protein YdeI (YjbR/CyaY-like superfamily)
MGDVVVWIQIAKRPETRARRIRESISLLAAGKKLRRKETVGGTHHPSSVE